MPRAKKNLSAVLDAVEDSVLAEKQEEYTVKVEETNDITHGLDTFEKLQDNLNCALQHAEAEIARIDERAEIAIQVVTQSIKTQAAVAKGKILLEIRENYSHLEGFSKNIEKFAARIGVPASTIRNWMAAASAVTKHENVFGKEFLMEQPATSLAMINTLPEKIQDAVMEDSLDNGRVPTQKELKELSSQTSVKLMKAEEKLTEVKEKAEASAEDWEMVKSDPDIKPDSEEYQYLHSAHQAAKKSLEVLNGQISQLKADLVGEKAKAESAKKAQEKLNEEIESLKFDDTAAREQRIKRISATLTINIPQILSDLMKFTAEEDLYLDNYKDAIRQQMVQLHTYLGEHI